MAGMHDAPLISPENKDADADVFAQLPKITLFEELGATVAQAGSPADLTAAVSAHLQRLVDDHVVYAELRFTPASTQLAAEEALAAAVAGLDVEGIDARIIVTAERGAQDPAAVTQLARLTVAQHSGKIVGFELAADNGQEGQDDQAAAPLAGFAEAFQALREAYVPFAVRLTAAGEAEDIGQALQAGATRLTLTTGIIDDFSATLEGIEPGRVSAWVRDRHILLDAAPRFEVDRGEIEELVDHPLPLLQQLGFNCAVSSGSWETGSMTEQLSALAETFGYGLEEFFDLSVNAIEHSFATQEDRQHLLETVFLPAYEELSDAEFAEDHHEHDGAEDIPGAAETPGEEV